MAFKPPSNSSSQPQIPSGNQPPGKGGGSAPGQKPMTPKAVAVPPKIAAQQEADMAAAQEKQQEFLQRPDTPIDSGYAISAMARVLEDLVEPEEDPTWAPVRLQLAEQWLELAKTLLEHDINIAGQMGDLELKKQQMRQQEEMHQQSLVQNDQMHGQKMKQNDEHHKLDIQQKQVMNKQTQAFGDQKNKMQMQQAGEVHKSKMQFTKQQQQQRMQQAKHTHNSAAKKTGSK